MLKLQHSVCFYTMPDEPVSDQFMADLLKARYTIEKDWVEWFDEPEEYQDMADDHLFRDRWFSMNMNGYDAAICVAALRWIPNALRRIARLTRENAELRKTLEESKNIAPKAFDGP